MLQFLLYEVPDLQEVLTLKPEQLQNENSPKFWFFVPSLATCDAPSFPI